MSEPLSITGYKLSEMVKEKVDVLEKFHTMSVKDLLQYEGDLLVLMGFLSKLFFYYFGL